MHASLRWLLPLLALLLQGGKPPPVTPPVVLWAWERPEDLRFLQGHEVGVAFLASTLRVRDTGVVEVPRRQPLRVPEETELTAVVRIEADARVPLDERQQDQILDLMLKPVRTPGVRRLQVDFDASLSQRPSYGALLRALRAKLPEGTSLSITALASWCVFDRWLDDANLPVDEVVPMVFAMGSGGLALLARLDADGDFRSPACRHAIGFATWEQTPNVPVNRRTYWFHDGPWTPMAFARVRSEALQ